MEVVCERSTGDEVKQRVDLDHGVPSMEVAK